MKKLFTKTLVISLWLVSWVWVAFAIYPATIASTFTAWTKLTATSLTEVVTVVNDTIWKLKAGTTWQILIWNTTNGWDWLAAGTTWQVLTANTWAAPTWWAAAAWYTDAQARLAHSVLWVPLHYNSWSWVISIDQANTTTPWYLSSADWNTFNGKLSNNWSWPGTSLAVWFWSVANTNQASAFWYISTATGVDSSAFWQGTSSWNNSMALWFSNTSQSFWENVLWLWATTWVWSATTYIPTDRLFVIGNGTAYWARSNALVMLKNGNTTLNWTLTATSYNGVALSTAAWATNYLAWDGTYKAIAAWFSNFTEWKNTTGLNTVIPVNSITASWAETNIDLAISPKWTWAFQLGQSDWTATGGNKRGIAAIDLQTFRSAAVQVASWSTSVAIWTYNTVSSNGSVALWSTNTVSWLSSSAVWYGNISSSDNSTSIWFNNTASTSTGTSAIWYQNTASWLYWSAIWAGSTASWLQSTAVWYTSVASWVGSSSFWGWNTASWNLSISLGYQATAQSYWETTMWLWPTVWAGTAASYVATDRLFVIGNGTAVWSKSDALVMLKNGNTTLNWNFTATNFYGNWSNLTWIASWYVLQWGRYGTQLTWVVDNFVIPKTWTIKAFKISLLSKPVGTDFIVTFSQNGVVIATWGTQSILTTATPTNGMYITTSAVLSQAVTENDLITVNVTQVWSTTPGADFTYSVTVQ